MDYESLLRDYRMQTLILACIGLVAARQNELDRALGYDPLITAKPPRNYHPRVCQIENDVSDILRVQIDAVFNSGAHDPELWRLASDMFASRLFGDASKAAARRKQFQDAMRRDAVPVRSKP